MAQEGDRGVHYVYHLVQYIVGVLNCFVRLAACDVVAQAGARNICIMYIL